jgi:DNA-binding transcriptional MerR regulator
VSDLLAIGDFARATHLSVKTLRHYHDLGLLVPASVDVRSGYRRYSTEQIPVGHVVRRFRDLDMPLEQIRAVLDARDLPSRNRLIAEHLARLEDALNRTHSAVASLRDILQGPPPAAAIRHRSEPALQTVAISETVEAADLSPWFQGALDELHATLAAQDEAAVGPAGAVVDDAFFTDEHGAISVYLPTARRVRAVGRAVALTLPPVELAVIVHEGSHVDIDRSYGALAAHVAHGALSVGGPLRERYLVGGRETTVAADWRTEIGWPVFRVGAPRPT